MIDYALEKTGVVIHITAPADVITKTIPLIKT